MNFYRVHGSDSRSDNGCYEIIIQAGNKSAAIAFAKKHLKKSGRNDLIIELTLEDVEKMELGSDRILHSTVECKRSNSV